MLMPRGLRNANPGNIRKSDIAWVGEAAEQPDPDFVTFSDPVYGLRAVGKILLSYNAKYGLCTVGGIVLRWAPPSENDTVAYARHVAAQMGVQPSDRLTVTDPMTLGALIRAIVRHECGQWPYSTEQLARAVNLALVKSA